MKFYRLHCVKLAYESLFNIYDIIVAVLLSVYDQCVMNQILNIG